jgi:hypothetical protein
MSSYTYEDAALRTRQKADTARLLDLGSAAGDSESAFLQPIVAGSGIGGGGFLKKALIAGGAAGDRTVTGIKSGDELVQVLQFVGAGVALTDIVDLTSEFTAATGKINNSGGTATTGDKLLVLWIKKTV